MSELLDTLPEGCTLLRDFLPESTQQALVNECRNLIQHCPLVTPTIKGGFPMSVRIASWGSVGWHMQNGYAQYLEKHPETGQPYPEIPWLVWGVVREALAAAGLGFESLDTVLMNWYARDSGKLGMHVDDTEQDRKSPIVTISLGDSSRFDIAVPQQGQWSRKKVEKPRGVNLLSGDVLIMAGKARMLPHGIADVVYSPRNKFMKNGGRISLTARKVFI